MFLQHEINLPIYLKTKITAHDSLKVQIELCFPKTNILPENKIQIMGIIPSMLQIHYRCFIHRGVCRVTTSM